jgi:hypothetical protein
MSHAIAHCARCGHRCPISLDAWISHGEILRHCGELMQIVASLSDVENAIETALEHEVPAVVTARLAGGVVTPGETPD